MRSVFWHRWPSNKPPLGMMLAAHINGDIRRHEGWCKALVLPHYWQTVFVFFRFFEFSQLSELSRCQIMRKKSSVEFEVNHFFEGETQTISTCWFQDLWWSLRIQYQSMTIWVFMIMLCRLKFKLHIFDRLASDSQPTKVGQAFRSRILMWDDVGTSENGWKCKCGTINW